MTNALIVVLIVPFLLGMLFASAVVCLLVWWLGRSQGGW